MKYIVLLFALVASTAFAQNRGGEYAPGSYVAGIWVDPDGCQHWVMDLGIEGMMSPVMTRDGKPVCNVNWTSRQYIANRSN